MNKSLVVIGILLASIVHAHGQDRGSIRGKVTETGNKEGLPGTTIVLAGSAIGTVTDFNGDFTLQNLPAGKQIIEISFLGYSKKSVEVNIDDAGITILNFELAPDIQNLDEIVISAQALGQAGAINQQINANTIINVVSRDRIRELPDQNAAEVVGRLPGISVQRNAGEGQKVVVRGLSPRFNSITVNGERIPSTDTNDRSVDLSMMSADALAGIEVFKALTPDKDGDAVGGTINFVTKKAGETEASMRLLYGYNGLAKEFGQYRMDGSVGKRFFNEKLGVIISGNFQKANRNSQSFGANYFFDGIDTEGKAQLPLSEVSLDDRQETRIRYGGSSVIDYKIDAGNSIILNTVLGFTDRDEIRRRRRYRAESSRQEYDIRQREIETRLLTNILTGEHRFKKTELTWRASYSSTSQDNPFNHEARFRENSAFPSLPPRVTDPNVLIANAANNISRTFFQVSNFDQDEVTSSGITAQVDYKIPIKISQKIQGYIKAGGKYRNDFRDRDVTRFWTNSFGTNQIGQENPGRYTMTDPVNGEILIENFVGNFRAPQFLNGDYFLGIGPGVNGPHLDINSLNAFRAEWFNDFYVLDGRVDLGDYKSDEKIYAGYLMTELKVGNKLTLLGGFRHETTDFEYTSVFGRVGSDQDDDPTDGPLLSRRDTIFGRSYNELLPMAQVRYKFTPWFDVRAAFTKTLSRPNFFFLVPWQRINVVERSIEQGNPLLEHTKAFNYDLFLSFYNSRGLFTVGGFYKELKDIDFIRQSNFRASDGSIFELTSPENAPQVTKVKGIEVDMQANFRFLPKPFDGIVAGANVTLIQSSTMFPFTDILRNPTRPLNTERPGRLPGQAELLYNISIGYEKKGFSGRVSALYQGNSLGAGNNVSDTPGGFATTVGPRSELDSFTDATLRIDVALKQKIRKGLQVYLNLNNLTNQPEVELLGNGAVTREEFFGMTADLGLSISF